MAQVRGRQEGKRLFRRPCSVSTRYAPTLSRATEATTQRAGLSQRQLADFVGVSTAAVSCWETGIREVPAGNNLVKLAEALGLDPADVMKVDGKSATARNEVQLLAAFRALPEERQAVAIKLVEAL